ncbi:MAG: glycosyltransferase family 2 protein [Lachnospiraceae bacterium]|nr:glycosyltransferase family 2 protein [Lachnospiraceae bacterium]
MSVKVSICSPAYNNVSEVERMLKSIYEQDYTDFEVNISDDSTNDDICNMVKSKYPQVNYVHNKTPLGHIFNWNAAVKMAKGKYIKIMFSDDWFTDSTCLGKFVELLDKNPEVLLAFSGSRQVMLDKDMDYYDRKAEDEFISRLNKDYRLLFLGNQIGAPSAVIYRRYKDGSVALFDEKSNWASDMYLYFELLRVQGRYAWTDKPLISIGVHDHQYTESFTEKDIRIYKDYRYMFEKYELNKSKECREYFAYNFIVKYNQGIGEAIRLGIGVTLYFRKWFYELYNSVKCFVGCRIKRIIKK